MPNFLVTSPTGEKYRVTAPEGASEEDAIDYVRRTHGGESPKPKVPDINAPPSAADLEEPQHDLPKQGIMSRIREGITAPWQEPWGSTETLLQQSSGIGHLFHETVENPIVAAAQLMARPVQSILGGVAGGVAGGAEAAGMPTAWANRLQRDFLQFPAAMGPELAIPGATMQRIGGETASLTGRLKQAPANAYRALDRATGNALPSTIRKLLGTDQISPEDIAAMSEIVEKGGKLGVKSFAPEAAFLSRMQQIAKGFGYDPVKRALAPFYEREAGQIAREAGAGPEPLTTPGQPAVSGQELGAAVKAKATETIDAAANELSGRVAAYKQAKIGPAAREAQEAARNVSYEQQSLVAASEKARAAATAFADRELSALQSRIENMGKGEGADPAALMRDTETRLRDLRRQDSAYFRSQYSAADALAEGHYPEIAGIESLARDMSSAVLPAVEAQFPREVGLLKQIGRVGEEEAPASKLLDQWGQPIPSPPAAPPEPVTFGQLHELRNWLRHSINWEDLTPGPKQGVFKALERQVDAALHNQEAAPELQAAARLLDATDAEYARRIPRYKDAAITSIVRSGMAAAPENAPVVARMLLDKDNHTRIAMAKDMLGPDIWNRILAADFKQMTETAIDERGAFDPVKFARSVIQRNADGVLAPAFGDAEAKSMVDIARRLQQVYGKFDTTVLPGDTVSTLLARSEDAMRRAENLAASQPFQVFQDYAKRVERDAKAMEQAGQEKIEANPLYALTRPSLEDEAAANRILSDRDMLRAAVSQWGSDSTEMGLLRATYARRLFQQEVGNLADLPEKWAAIPRDVQDILFPGTSRDGVQKLMRQLRLMFPAEDDRTAMGMAGMSWLMHPQNAPFFPKGIRSLLGTVPAFAGRVALQTVLSKISDIASSPALFRFVTTGLTGTPVQEAAANGAIWAIGLGYPPKEALAIGMSALMHDMTKEPEEDKPPSPRRSWRDRLREGRSQPKWMDRVRSAP
jgi:hypothetical protein